jgi:hypothetical protein
MYRSGYDGGLDDFRVGNEGRLDLRGGQKMAGDVHLKFNGNNN